VVADPHALANPHRSCKGDDGEPGPGGKWHYPRARFNNGNPLFAADLAAVRARLTPVGLPMLMSEIRAKMKRGAIGELAYGHGDEFDVERILSTDYVLEIRLEKKMGDEPMEQLHTRIYFTEPSREPDTLKFLAMDCKHDDEKGGHDEQDAQALRAQGRLGSCDFFELKDSE
jgi:hypothetical protein